MSTLGLPHESHGAVLVDCDNVPTDIMEHAKQTVAFRHQLVRKKSPRRSGG